MTEPRQLKKRKCRQCKTAFTPWSSLSIVCSVKCAIAYGKLKAQRREATARRKLKQYRHQQKKEFLAKDRSHQLRLRQSAFNAWIRARDHDQPCISCDTSKGLMHAGHYRSVGAAPELRFNPWNAHNQCAQCNSTGMKSGNVVEYRIRLVWRIGVEMVDWIEGPHDPARWTCEELMMVRSAYRAAIRRLEKQGESIGE